MTAPEVGFVGLGRMGAPMARRLLDAGLALRVHNRTAASADALVAAGARWAATPAEAADGAAIVVTMVAGPEAARAVVTGPSGVLAAARPPGLVIEMSTIGPDVARELAAAAAAAGSGFLESPVSGSVGAALQGTLLALVGGGADDLERARPVLAALSREQVLLGPVGAGAAMKLVLNGLLAVYNQGLGEALALAEGSGIDRAAAWALIARTGVGAPYMTHKEGAFLRPGDAPVAFTIDLMAKDAALALALAERTGVELPAVAAAHAALTAAGAAGHGDRDLARVAEPSPER